MCTIKKIFVGVVAVSVVGVVIGIFLLFMNQRELYGCLIDIRAEANQTVRPEMRVIERVASQQLWTKAQDIAKDTVVQILAQTAEIDLLRPYETPRQGGGCGSGFFISDDGLIVTNAHVANEAQAIWIKIPSLGKEIIDVDLVGMTPDRDLALLRVTSEGLDRIKQELGSVPFLKLGDSDVVHRSDEVLSLGYPLGQMSLKSTSGVVSGPEHSDGRHLIQISAPINPGSSGGPAINVLGEVIGIACSGIPGAQNVGYIIPVNELKLCLEDLQKVTLLRRPFLGVLLNNSNYEMADYFGNPQPSGAYVLGVYEGGPLAKGGVKEGDVLYEINGHRIDSHGDLRVPWSEDKISVIDYVGRLEIGQKVHIVVYRQGKRKDIYLTFNFSQLAPVRRIFPGYDTIDYEIIGGMLIQPLSLNHLPRLVNNAPSLTKYTDLKNQMEPALVVTHVMPNSRVQRLDVINRGTIIKEINGKQVATMDEFKDVLNKGAGQKYITVKTTDDVFFVLPLQRALEEDVKLSSVYKYPVSSFVKKLLDVYESDGVNKNKTSK